MTNGQQEISTDKQGEQEEAELEQAEEEFKKEHKNTETVPRSADPRLEEAEEAFHNQLENIGTAEAEASEKTPSPNKEETAKENQQILAALGFKPYNDAGVIKYNIRVLDIKIGVTFNETNPLGKIWAYKIPEGDEEKEFLKNGDLKSHPLMQKYEAIKEGKEPLPETTVTGKILEKRGKAIKVEIIENGEVKEIFYGQGAVKKDNDGYFLPAGFSKSGKDKEGKEHDAKMALPRDIRLPGYLTQLEQAPAADTTKKEDVPKEKGELPKKPDELAKTDLQPTDKGTLAEVIKPAEMMKILLTQELPPFVGIDGKTYALRLGLAEIPKENAEALIKSGVATKDEQPPAVAELIAKYVEILSLVTEAVAKEDRIKDREKGYAVKFVYYSVKGAIENGKGDDHEEQA